jgi:hypothetical protein
MRVSTSSARAAATSSPVGAITRGTTAPRRLRRVDRWLVAANPRLVATPRLLVVDLGFGARPFTTLELAARLRRINPGSRVVGLEIDHERVAAAAPFRTAHVEFAVGGFEMGGRRPHLVRALNVLRQYDEDDVPGAWARMSAALAPGGMVVEGTCDESGRLGAWLSITRECSSNVALPIKVDGQCHIATPQPTALTLAVDLAMTPSAVAARLPKALIHHNVEGEPVHDLLRALDAAWHRSAALSTFSARQRFAAAAATVRDEGWPVLDGPGRWRRGELTVKWDAVRPVGR